MTGLYSLRKTHGLSNLTIVIAESEMVYLEGGKRNRRKNYGDTDAPVIIITNGAGYFWLFYSSQFDKLKKCLILKIKNLRKSDRSLDIFVKRKSISDVDKLLLFLLLISIRFK